MQGRNVIKLLSEKNKILTKSLKVKLTDIAIFICNTAGKNYIGKTVQPIVHTVKFRKIKHIHMYLINMIES